jgi:hypothetical protein
MLAQLLLTIKKKIDDGNLPPRFLGAFDVDKICFVEFHNALEIFNLNDFDWTETPSSVSDKTTNTVRNYIPDKNLIKFNFAQDDKELKEFIKYNFVESDEIIATEINKNNFVTIYNKWVANVFPHINIDLEAYKKKYNINEADFYLADLMSLENKTIIEKLRVILEENKYLLNIYIDETLFQSNITFKDEGKKHASFWNRYKRPPKDEYHEYILQRRDLLVPQNIRERKGAFFTPQQWVEKSQQYLADAFGEDWQDEYIIWDPCCGTGNLEVGLTNPRNIWCSTLDQSDVDIIHNSIEEHAKNLFKKQVFQFDFLNDNFEKLPKELNEIINAPEKRKKTYYLYEPAVCGGDYRYNRYRNRRK